MSNEQMLMWLAAFVRSPNRWVALRSATERTALAGVELNLLPDGTLRDVSAGAVGRLATCIKAVDPLIALAWQMLSLQRTDAPFVIQSVVKGCMALLTGAKGDTQVALAHLRTWDDIACGRIEVDDDDFFRAATRENIVASGMPACVELLDCARWDDAFSWLSEENKRQAGNDVDAWPPPRKSDRKVQRDLINTHVEMLWSQGVAWCGDLALAWQMMMCDPRRPPSFQAVMPQLTWSLEKRSVVSDAGLQDLLHAKLAVWWLGAAGRWEDSDTSIFRIADMKTAGHEYHSAPLAEFDGDPSLLSLKESRPVGPSVVVMRKDRAEERGLPQGWKDLRDQALPLVICRDAAEVRERLQDEYPHAWREVAMLTQDLRSGEPVRIKPTLLASRQPGTGKTRLVRRLAEAISPEMYIYRFDAASAFDGMYGGTPKGWSSAQASVPARAIMASKTANPIACVDEICKAGTGDHNGNLWSAMTPHLEIETSCRYRESSIDAELDLSHVIHLATANSVERLPSQLRDRMRVIRIPAPTLAHLPRLAALVMRDLAAEDDARSCEEPLAADELEILGRAWARERFSMRKLQRLVAATLEARDACARRH
ncbi:MULTISPECIES: AAA family ATPase [Bradyrhizobium]|uniref:AAA family ATPase n=1 Tax=Bradyrhizobium TaxID=374 RepID=UPI001EDBD6E3|nr:AAA family ATPase [Bradyrhizobium zhengyangense]MCG2645198.1 AAA family ATPase [Bradyrhizobium zhengyangense]